MTTIYFDNAATSWPKPASVCAALNDYFGEAGGNPCRSGHRMSIAAARIVENARETLKMLATIQTPKLGDPHGNTFVQVASDNRSAEVVADIGGPHGGVNPYAAFAKATVPTGASSNALTVVAREFNFAPATLDVTAGKKVTFEFENKDGVDHNIVSQE